MINTLDNVAPQRQQQITENLIELRDRVFDKMPKNTKKAYQQDFAQYMKFCELHSLTVMSDDWRITKISVRQYFDSMMNGSLKNASIKRKLSAIRYFIGVCECPDPFKHSKLLRDDIAMSLMKYKPEAQEQAEPITIQILERINNAIQPDCLLNIRNRLMINMAFDSLFRVSNMIAVDFKHIDTGQKSILAPKSKTDKTGKGRHAYISPTSLTMLNDWKNAAGIESGLVFRRLTPKQTVLNGGIAYSTAYRIYKELSDIIGLESNLYSCHSTRVGATISMMESGVELAQIAQAGHWGSPRMALRYAEQALASKGGMSKIR